jgi:ABC-type uncharacterized transport system substrate-binding protein
MRTKKSTPFYLEIIILVLIAVGLMGCSVAASTGNDTGPSPAVSQQETAAESAEVAGPKFKVLHIMSYHSPWEWTDGQLNGFKSALKGVDVEYKVIQMDTKNHSDEAWKQQVAQEAKDLIESWQPDLVYTTDDDVQKYVVKDYVNTDIPFVFSGVNANPEQYGFVGSKNVTGVIEHQHFIESVELLKKISPDVEKIAVVVDDSPFWKGVTETMRQEESQLPAGVEVVSYDLILTFDEYKQKVEEYQTTVDAMAMLGVFNFKDEKGENVPFQQVLQWTTENSTLPDFSFWEDRISHGTLSSVTVSSYEQGLAAGEMAREILVNGKSPAAIPMKPTVKGEPVINLARAKLLGIDIDSTTLLTAKVIQDFSWAKQQ